MNHCFRSALLLLLSLLGIGPVSFAQEDPSQREPHCISLDLIAQAESALLMREKWTPVPKTIGEWSPPPTP